VSVITVGRGDALLVIDVQNDFCPGGPLAVPGGHEVVPAVNLIARRFPLVVATQDWHPKGHCSFASTHAGKKPLETVVVGGTVQVLWPDHCVQGTRGADFHPMLDTAAFHYILRKGTRQAVDSYSAFVENDRTTRTGLDGLLKGLGIERVFVCGLATDYCVAASARDAVSAGFSVVLVEDACRGVDVPPGSLEEAIRTLRDLGVRMTTSSRVAQS